jgi:hypothetical protein
LYFCAVDFREILDEKQLWPNSNYMHKNNVVPPPSTHNSIYSLKGYLQVHYSRSPVSNDCCSLVAKMSSVGQLLLDNEKAVRKLSKVRQRRDHYARLYFQTLSQLEETRWKLSQAMNTIRELKEHGNEVTASMPVL